MKKKILALVVNIVRHSDTTDVATLYSREEGRLSVAVPARSKGRRSTNPPLMPLTVIEGEVSSRTGMELMRLWRFSIAEPLGALHSDPAKIAVGMFMSEFLGRLLREQAPDPAVWRAVATALLRLNEEENPLRVANFHIIFLWQMLPPAGIMPDIGSFRADEPQQWLDMRSGIYTSLRPGHSDVVVPQYAGVPLLLERLNFRSSHCLRITGEQRSLLADALLHYYAVHLPGMGGMKSHRVLTEVFRF